MRNHSFWCKWSSPRRQSVEARHLVPLYDRFTERLETADLKEAKARCSNQL